MSLFLLDLKLLSKSQEGDLNYSCMRQFQEGRLHKYNIGNVTWYAQAGNFINKEKV